jgi:hypothetical protein
MALARNQKFIIGAVAIVLLASFSYAGFKVVKKRQLAAQVAQLVSEAAGRLEPVLAVDINAPSAELLKTLDASIGATDAGLQQLRAAGTRLNPVLVESADDYIATVLNVLKRQAGSLRGRQQFAADHGALTAHLAHAGQRGSRWLNDAVKLRQQLDRAYFDFNTASTSLGNMLAGYPASRRTIVALLPSVPLPADVVVKEAQQRAHLAAEATRGEYERAKQLIAPG